MELSLDTYRKEQSHADSEEIGKSTVVIGEGDYRELERMEAKLKDSGDEEMLVGLAKRGMKIETPPGHDDMVDAKVRLFLDEDAHAGLFHFVGKSAADGSLMYTEPALVRLVAL